MAQTETKSQTSDKTELFENRIPTRLVDASELSMRLAIDPNKLYRLVKTGEIEGIKVGGSWRFDWEDVVSKLKQRSAHGHKRS